MESKSHSFSHGRVSRLASSCPRDFDFEFFVYQNEANYAVWWSRKRFITWFLSVPEETAWNCLLCIGVLLGLVVAISKYDESIQWIYYVDIGYNIVYATHMMAMIYEYVKMDHIKATWDKKVGLVVDFLSYVHYIALPFDYVIYRHIKVCCYFIRLQRPFRYLLALTDSNLNANIYGTLLKYMYFATVFRIMFTFIWVTFVKTYYDKMYRTKILHNKTTEIETLTSTAHGQFAAAYFVTKIFTPIGSELIPRSDELRIFYLVMMVTGALILSGAAVASLSLVLSLYLRPEEAFRARFRLIMKEMADTNMPASLREKVETFYKMYWHKQKGVSVTHLLPTFPPTIPASIFTDIYFEAQQKSPILRDLSYQFLWELAKLMKTENYIPGDAIISRNSHKSAIIYIAYGDVVMLTAEDDSTPLLRMTRGTILSACAGCAPIACSKALVEIRAATFCTAHVLKTTDLWKVALKYGRSNGQAFILLSAFEEHYEKIKRHYRTRAPYPVKYKSSILQFKRNLIALKEARDENGNLLLVRTDFFIQIAGCYIMRNRDDSALTEESDAICLRSTFPCILQPQSSLLAMWHGMISLMIVVVTFTHPYNLIFKNNAGLEFRFYDGVVTVLFVLDLIVHLSTGANVEEGVPITFGQTSTQQIQDPWFFVDLLGTLPIFELIGNGSFAGLNKLLRIPKVYRTLKAMEEVCVYHSNIVRFLSYALMLSMITYICSAIQYSYLCFVGNMCVVTNFTHSPFWTKGVVTDSNIKDTVTYSVYSALGLVTFTSHKMFPLRETTSAYLLLTFVLVELSMIVHICIEAMYSATIMVTTAMEDNYETTIQNLRNFLIRNRMDPMLRFRFIQYLELCWYTDKAYSITHNKRSILYDLPNHVYKDILARQRNQFILCLPFMKFVHHEHLKLISSQASLFYTSPNEILLNTGDITTEIYIIKRGFCEVYDPNTHQVVDLISEKKYFGVLECLLRFPAYYTVRAVTHVQIFSISRKYLGSVIENPQIKEVIESLKKQPEFRKVSTRREGFMEYERPPPIPNRYIFPLLRKFEPDTAFMLPFTRIGFLSVLKYVFPRSTIRPDGNYIMRYEWFRAICAFLTALIFPRYCFLQLYQFSWLYEVTLVLDITAYFDIVQRLLIGYYNHKGILVSHPVSTASHYMKGAFIVDLMACLPLEHIEHEHYEHPAIPREMQITTIEMKQFLMMNRLLQLYRLPGAMDVLKEYISRRDVILVIRAIPMFMVLMNLFTSLLAIHSVDVYDKTLFNSFNYSQMIPHSNSSWINLFNSLYHFDILETPWTLFVTIFFWVTSEVVSTGYDIQKPDHLEQMETLMTGMFMGAMIITYFSVLVISIRANVNVVLAKYQQNIRDLSLFMRRERLELNLQTEIINYYYHNWNKMGGLDYRNVLKLCDQITLRTDAIVHIYGPTFAKCPILYHCDLSLLRVMGRAVHSLYFQENTRIIESDDVIADMYFIEYGTIDVTSRDIHTSQDCVKLTRGSVFGNMEAKRTVRCPTAMVATSNVHLLQINSVMFHTIILDFPTVRVLMKKYRPHNENFIAGAKSDGGSTLSITGNPRSSSRISISGFVSSRKKISKIFSPENKFLQAYFVIICLACIYADIYNAGFQNNSLPLIITLYCLDFLFLVKMFICFILPLLMREGEGKDYLMDLRKTYKRTELKYDVISILPLEAFFFLSKDRKRRWIWFALLRLNRLARTKTVYKCLEQQQERLSMNIVLSTAVSVFIGFSLFAHIASCMWHALGVYNTLFNHNKSWMNIQTQYGREPCHNEYICSLYFVVSTFTMSGSEILPKMPNELTFVSLLQIVSTLIFMLYVGEFSNIFQYTSYTAFSYYTQCLELEEFLSNNRVSLNLQSIVKKYNLHLWHRSKGVQVPYFLKTAPPCFKLSIMSAAYMHHLTKCNIFRDCEPAFLRQLVGCLKLYTYCENIFVVKESEITDSMYILHEGLVQEIDEDMDESNQRGKTFVSGEVFGVPQGLVWNTPFTYSYCAKINSQALTLSLRKWEYLLEHFPQSKYLIYKNVPGHPYGKPPEPDSEETPEVVVDKPPPSSMWGADKRRRSTVYEKMAMADLSDIEINKFSTDSDEEISPAAVEQTATQEYNQEIELEDENQRMMKRRPTFFQKVAQKLTSGPADRDRRKTIEFLASEGKDTLLYEEEVAATNALLGDFKDEDIQDTRLSELVLHHRKPEASKTPDRPLEIEKKDDEEEESVARRAPRLSFIPGLVQKQMMEDKPVLPKQKLNMDKDDDDDLQEDEEELASKKAPRLSFLPGLVQRDKYDDEDDDDEEDKKAPKQAIVRPESPETRKTESLKVKPSTLPLKITDPKIEEPLKSISKTIESSSSTTTQKSIDETGVKHVRKLTRDDDDDDQKPFYIPSIEDEIGKDDLLKKQIGITSLKTETDDYEKVDEESKVPTKDEFTKNEEKSDGESTKPAKDVKKEDKELKEPARDVEKSVEGSKDGKDDKKANVETSEEPKAGPSKTDEDQLNEEEYNDIDEFLLKSEETEVIDDYIKGESKGIAGLKRLIGKDKSKDQSSTSRSSTRVSKRIVQVRYDSQDQLTVTEDVTDTDPDSNDKASVTSTKDVSDTTDKDLVKGTKDTDANAERDSKDKAVVEGTKDVKDTDVDADSASKDKASVKGTKDVKNTDADADSDSKDKTSVKVTKDVKDTDADAGSDTEDKASVKGTKDVKDTDTNADSDSKDKTSVKGTKDVKDTDADADSDSKDKTSVKGTKDVKDTDTDADSDSKDKTSVKGTKDVKDTEADADSDSKDKASMKGTKDVKDTDADADSDSKDKASVKGTKDVKDTDADADSDSKDKASVKGTKDVKDTDADAGSDSKDKASVKGTKDVKDTDADADSDSKDKASVKGTKDVKDTGADADSDSKDKASVKGTKDVKDTDADADSDSKDKASVKGTKDVKDTDADAGSDSKDKASVKGTKDVKDTDADADSDSKDKASVKGTKDVKDTDADAGSDSKDKASVKGTKDVKDTDADADSDSKDKASVKGTKDVKDTGADADRD